MDDGLCTPHHRSLGNKIGSGRGEGGGNETMMKVTWADGSKKEELPRRRFSDIYI